jgi:hypothetical protein
MNLIPKAVYVVRPYIFICTWAPNFDNGAGFIPVPIARWIYLAHGHWILVCSSRRCWREPLIYPIISASFEYPYRIFHLGPLLMPLYDGLILDS